jgi:hypothetical protein
VGSWRWAVGGLVAFVAGDPAGEVGGEFGVAGLEGGEQGERVAGAHHTAGQVARLDVGDGLAQQSHDRADLFDGVAEVGAQLTHRLRDDDRGGRAQQVLRMVLCHPNRGKPRCVSRDFGNALFLTEWPGLC